MVTLLVCRGMACHTLSAFTSDTNVGGTASHTPTAVPHYGILGPYPSSAPPLRIKSMPVMKLDCSLARKRQVWPASSMVPLLPRCCVLSSQSCKPLGSGEAATLVIDRK